MKENEWKELDLNGYEYETKYDYLMRLTHIKYRSIKRQPKAPTHEEIMTKWWKGVRTWAKVEAYDHSDREYYIHLGCDSKWYKKEDFAERQSATIPPEEN